MHTPAARFGLWIAVAVATGLGVYTEVRDPAGFARIAGIVLLGATAIVIFERRRMLDSRAAFSAERDALADAVQVEQLKAEELERLLQLAEYVGNSTDIEHLQRDLQHSLAPLVRTRDIWLTARVGGWQDVFRDRVIESPTAARVRRGWETFPLRVAGKAIGVLGVAQDHGPFAPRERRFMTYAASIIGIALKNVQLFQAIKEQSVTDALTGCATRSHGLDLLAREVRRAARSGTTAAVLMIDADHFKAVNDQYGHLCGDNALRHIGRVLKTSVRVTDLPCRYGGEEFLILLPETSSSGAAKVAESIRQMIATGPVACGMSMIQVTVSCGVATTRPGELDSSALIARADAALYEAKCAGRNRVHVHGEPQKETRDTRTPAEGLSGERRDPARRDRRQHPGGRRASDVPQVH